jgi:hypothetical protein
MKLQEIEEIAYELILKNRKPIDIAELKGEKVPKQVYDAHTIYAGAISDFLVVLSDVQIEEPKITKNPRALNNCPIWEMSDYKNYRKTRVYNSKTKTSKVEGEHVRRTFYLPFESLITIIEDYKNGISIQETFTKIKGATKTPQGLLIYRNMYRAGAFNDAIYENALTYGYKPDELISNEKMEC